jgi:hypothetical protein
MSQKSSLPQAASFVSQVLKRDTRHPQITKALVLISVKIASGFYAIFAIVRLVPS